MGFVLAFVMALGFFVPAAIVSAISADELIIPGRRPAVTQMNVFT